MCTGSIWMSYRATPVGREYVSVEPGPHGPRLLVGDGPCAVLEPLLPERLLGGLGFLEPTTASPPPDPLCAADRPTVAVGAEEIGCFGVRRRKRCGVSAACVDSRGGGAIRPRGSAPTVRHRPQTDGRSAGSPDRRR